MRRKTRRPFNKLEVVSEKSTSTRTSQQITQSPSMKPVNAKTADSSPGQSGGDLNPHHHHHHQQHSGNSPDVSFIHGSRPGESSPLSGGESWDTPSRSAEIPESGNPDAGAGEGDIPTQTTQSTQTFNECSQSSQADYWGVLIWEQEEMPREYFLKESITVGRSAENTIVVDACEVSKFHFEIEYDSAANRAYIFDAKSRNGTFVNNTRVPHGVKRFLNTNDVITASCPSEATFRFVNKYESDNKFNQCYAFTDRILGNGASSVVRECRNRRTGELCAVKVINKNKFESAPKVVENFKKEVDILSKLDHPNIIRFIDFVEDESSIYIVLELAAGGNLLEHLERGPFSETAAKAVFRQLLEGIEYLHAHDIAHRDLKPANILVSEDTKSAEYRKRQKAPTVKIADFGVAINIVGDDAAATSMCGTVKYAAPELLMAGCRTPGNAPGKEGDKLIKLSGVHPFRDDNGDTSLFDQITKGLYSFPDNQWKEISNNAKDLIRNLLSTDPSTRFTPSQALAHPWFSEVCILTPTTPGGSSHVVTRKQTSDLRKMGSLSPSALRRSVVAKNEQTNSVQRTIDFYSQSPGASPSGKSRIKVLPSPDSPSRLPPPPPQPSSPTTVSSSSKKRKLSFAKSPGTPLKKPCRSRSNSATKKSPRKTLIKTDSFVQKKLTFD